MTLGEQIKEKREALKMTQEDLAEQLGISRQAVSKWESDLSVPSSENLKELAKILHLSIEAESESLPSDPKKKNLPVPVQILALIAAVGWGISILLGGILYQQISRREITGSEDSAVIEDTVPEENIITAIDLYDAEGELIQKEDNWYVLKDSSLTIVVTFEGEPPTTVSAYLYPTGTNTSDERKQLAVESPKYGDTYKSYVLMHVDVPDGTMAHLEITLDYSRESTSYSTCENYLNLYY